ncbi:hypothetical protein ACHIPZ_21770 [Antrihabitans sp. NCIMB 15449]|uniref:DUF2207 domain-containing protein n=1 Tax=Antrihabitans spumae TaxID=3373370 RepID=A0ABW7JW76_9NOCA
MLVLTLVLAAVGFGLLIVSLVTGSVVWAWGCIAACVVGALLLLASALTTRSSADGTVSSGAGAVDLTKPAPDRRKKGRHSQPPLG